MTVRGAVIMLVALSCCPVVADAQVFIDNFDGISVDGTKWNWLEPVSVGGGTVTLLPNVGYFPSLSTRINPFPTAGGYVLSVRMRWPAYGGYGNGLTPGAYDLGPGFGAQSDLCCMWAGHNGAISVSCGDTYPIPVTSYPDTSWHLYQWKFSSGVYTFYFDGVARAASASTYKPTVIRFGATNAPSSNGWNTVEVDYVRVDTGFATEARTSTWSRVKTFYR